MCETLKRGVCLDKYNEIFEDIICTVNTIVRMDTEIERRSKLRSTLKLHSINEVSRGGGPPGQVPISVKSTAEASK